jgi:hypothetical protein
MDGLIPPSTAIVFLGLAFAAWMLMNRRRGGKFVLLIFVILAIPVIHRSYQVLQADRSSNSREADLAYLHNLCSLQAGDKIMKRVDNVQGVLQMRRREPISDRQWADKSGMPEPWAAAFGDGPQSALVLAGKGEGYWFIEQMPESSEVTPHRYRRKLLRWTGKKVGDQFPFASNKEAPAYSAINVLVRQHAAKYGYRTTDLTTKEMRERWISGGRLEVVDLTTGEVLGERTDFYRATGPEVKMAWAPGIPCPQSDRMFVKSHGLGDFVVAVLRPPAAFPTDSQLTALAKDQ